MYNTGTEASCAAINRLESVNAGRFFINAKVFSGYQSCTTQPESWHQYGPAAAYDRQGSYSASVSPGFFEFNEATPRLGRDLAGFKANLTTQAASGAQWQLITTFNEWGEGSAVEPATLWISGSGNGEYLDAMRNTYLGAPPPSTATSSTTATPTTPTPTFRNDDRRPRDDHGHGGFLRQRSCEE